MTTTRVQDRSVERWAWCELGHRHWGAAGAAGLFICSRDNVLLGQRSADTDFELRWGIPSGARLSGETPQDTAIRETLEETSLSREAFSDPVGSVVADHGNWTFTTVFARATAACPQVVFAADNETINRFRWLRLISLSPAELMPSLIDLRQQPSKIPKCARV